MATVKSFVVALCLVLASFAFTGFSAGLAGATDEACIDLEVGEFEVTGVDLCR